MALLSRDQIFDADDLTTQDVPVPEWGGEVRIKMLTGAERDRFEQSTVDMRGNKPTQNLANLRARLVALCVVDEHGARMFSKDDVGRLGSKSAAALDRVFDAASKLNGMSEADIEELTEGFDNDPDGSSPSD